MKKRLFLVLGVLMLGVAPLRAGSASCSAVATLDITVSQDAAVFVDGVQLDDDCPIRHFVTPVLDPCLISLHEVRAVWNVNGHESSLTQRVSLGAGDRKGLLFNGPPDDGASSAGG